MRFEWNDTKRWSNVVKHGIDFVDVVRAFDQPMLVIVDQRRDYGEIRRRAVGNVGGQLITIVFTERDGGVRLISARRANAKERAQYQTQYQVKSQDDERRA
jgi:uncharacterized protein